MKTTVYLIRHAEPFKIHRGNINTTESILLENEKSPLSINGESMAEEIAIKEEFKNLDLVCSSNYVRTMSTAKYFAYNNKLKVDIDERFNERIHGINDYSELPINFELNQVNDENYKMPNGESKKEVKERMLSAFNDIINENKGKRILIVGHATAFSFLLSNWCEINYQGEYKFNNKAFFDGKWNYLETFKLEFDENNNLLKITNIKFNK